MQRLSGLDAMFFYLETPSNHMHLTGVFLLDPSEAPDGHSFDQVREMVAGRLHRAAPFRRRLVEVPFRLAHPVWVEDPNFDLDYHVRRACLPSPGGTEELEAFVAQVVGLPLDRDRPLWEMYVVEGLAGGQEAVVVKMHHAAIDGVSGAELTATWLDLEPSPTPDPDDVDDWEPERLPNELDLLVDALTQLVGNPLKAVKMARRLMESALHVTEHNREAGVHPPPSPFSAPRTSFNQAITPHRRVAFASVGLDELKRVKDRFGCTVNDVVLAVCSGALRRYLLEEGDLPEQPLVGFVPMSVRTEADAGTGGNRISAMLTSLATDIEAPVERLAAIAASMGEAKTQETLIGADVLTDWTEFTFPALIGRASRVISSMRVFDRVRPAFNVTISNVPGPTFPLYVAGARMVGMYPLGPVVEGAGLNVTVMSYCGVVYFGCVSCRETMPRLGELPGLLADSLDELLAAAGLPVEPTTSEQDAGSPTGEAGTAPAPRQGGGGSSSASSLGGLVL